MYIIIIIVHCSPIPPKAMLLWKL